MNLFETIEIKSNNSFTQNCTLFKNGTIFSDNIFNNLILTPGYTYTLYPATIQTISSSLTAAGNCGALININSFLAGTQASFKKISGSVTLDFVTLKDINAMGGATFTANNAISLGNNTGWIINPLSPKTLFWIGNSGNWNDGTHWSLSSGGAPSGCSPTPVDDVFFNANSFTASGQTVTINSPTVFCKTMSWSGVTNTPTFNLPLSSTLRIFGSLLFVPGVTTNLSGYINFESTSPGNNITTAGKNFFTIVFNGIGGAWTLLDNISFAKFIKLINGSLNTNGQTTLSDYFENQAGSTSLNLGNSVINVNSQWYMGASGLTLNAGTSTINMTGVGGYPYFYGGNRTYNKLNFTASSYNGFLYDNNTFNGNVNFYENIEVKANNIFNKLCYFHKNGLIISNNTIHVLALSPAYTLTLTSGTTQTIAPSGYIFAIGTGAFPIRIQASVSGSPAYIIKTGAAVCLDYVRMSDNVASGGAVFNAGLSPTRSFDMGGNSGWLFTGGCVLPGLPLNLLSFNAKLKTNTSIELLWSVANTANTHHFDIERSSDGVTFKLLGQTPFTGAPTGIVNYSFIDNHPENETNYYRLRIVDVNGDYSFSKIVSVNISNNSLFELSPNPANDILFIKLKGRVSELIALQIFDISGRLMHEETIFLGNQTPIPINIFKLPKGNYYLKLVGSKTHFEYKFIKQ